jgi:hypothetical protein
MKKTREMLGTYSSIEKIRAELAWVTETSDPNKCHFREILEKTLHDFLQFLEQDRGRKSDLLVAIISEVGTLVVWWIIQVRSPTHLLLVR